MKKKSFALLTLLMIAMTVWAQTAQNPKLSYQAVVRDNSNKLVTNSNIDVTISVLRMDNSLQYTQSFAAVPTNQNGLLSLIIGGEADWDDIDWLHSKIAVAITLPDLSVVKDTTEMNAVPLAINTMYSATVDPSSLVQSNWTQADTEDPSFILNKPSIKDTVNNILTTEGYVTETTLDGRHYLTSDSTVIRTMQSDIATNRTNISTNATNIQTNTTNIGNLILHTTRDAIRDSVAGQIHDSIANISSFIEQQVLSISNDTIYLTGGSYVKLPAGFSGDYNALTNKPTIPTTVAGLSDAANYLTNGAIDSLQNAQADWNQTSTTAKDYIKNKPTIPTVPTNVSAFTNDAGYLTSDSAVITTMQNNIVNLTLHTTRDAIRDSVAAQIHDSIANIPSFVEQQVLSISNDTIYLTGGSYVKLPAGFSGDYNALTNKPTIPTTVAGLSDAANYLTTGAIDSLQNAQADWNQTSTTAKNYIKNKPTIPTVPTNVSAFTNDAGYLTSDSAVITTMQSDIATNRTNISTNATNIQTNTTNIDNLIRHTAKAAIRDSVAGQIHDSISNIAAKAHTHENKALLDTYTQTEANLAEAVAKRHEHANADILNNTTATYTDADSIKLDGIENGAQKNVNADWAETNEDTCSFIRNKPELFSGSYNDLTNKPSIKDTVNNILTTDGYVTETTLDGRHYLTSDSAVITTMQSDIAANRTDISTNATNIQTNTTNIDNLIRHTTKAALRDSVAGQIHDSIANIAEASHTHSNKALLDTYNQTNANLADAVTKSHAHANADILNNTTATYTDADSIKLKGIAEGAEVNVQSDWEQTDGNQDDYIKNKPTIPTVPTNVSAFTNDAGYLTSNNEVITNLSQLLQQLTARLDAQNAKMDSLAQIVDSLSNLPHGGGDTPTEVADGQPCPGAATVSDGTNTYNTVKIGNQCWMAQNLRTNVGGGVYPKYPEDHIKAGQMVDDSLLYGRLYTWNAMMKGAPSTNYPAGTTEADTIVHGICPEGWHVPSDAEWTQLTTYVKSKSEYQCDGADNIANALSAAIGWSYNTSEGCYAGSISSTINLTGFSAVPAGLYNVRSSDFSHRAFFWSTTEYDSNNAYYRNLSSNDAEVFRWEFSKGDGYSVRCVRDAGIGGTPGENETGGTTPSAPATMSCEQVMECMGDTLGKLNTKIEEQGTEIETLNGTVTTQGQTIETLNSTVQSQGETITTQGHTIDSLAHIVDSLSNLTPGGGDTPTAFVCGTDKVKDVDDNEYNTVKIGNQCWMKENLRTKIGGDGDKGYPTEAGNDTITYGRLYTWSAMMKGAPSTNYPAGITAADTIVHGICPAGWHVPSNAEWTQLTTYVRLQPEYVCEGCSGTDDEWYTYCIAKALSQPTGWNSSTSEGCNAGNMGDKANATGFAAVPAGVFFDGYFTDFGGNASFWSATRYDDGYAWARYLDSYDSYVDSGYGGKDNGFSVRCLRDAGVGGGTTPSAPATMSCEQVMECMGDTLGKLNTKIEEQGAEIATLSTTVTEQGNTITAQGQTIDNLSNTVTEQSQTITTQGETIDSLAQIVDSLSNLIDSDGDGQPCPGAPTVSDGTNTYNTVQIGNQCWMKENLRTTTKRNGVGNIYTNNTQAGYNAETYGYYYDWAAVMQGASSTNYPKSGDKVQGICPEGWHVPSDSEWTALTTYVKTRPEKYQCGINADNIAKALSTATDWYSSNTPCSVGLNPGNNNSTGFAALPAGDYYNGESGGFSDLGSCANFWSSTEIDSGKARSYCLKSADFHVSIWSRTKIFGYSVRCLRDGAASATMSCDDVMECMGDTLGKLNAKIEENNNDIVTLRERVEGQEQTIENLQSKMLSQDNTIDSLKNTISSQDSTINALNEQVEDLQPFECGKSKAKDAGGNEYNTVQIGNQCWMAQNLRTNVSGSVYPTDVTGDDTVTYGRLYTWTTATKGASTTYPQNENDTLVHGICPVGWHVPSKAEWDTLITYVINVPDYKCGLSNNYIANALSSSTGWNNPSSCGAGYNSPTLNKTGFAAVPAGSNDTKRPDFGTSAYFWSVTEATSSTNAYVYSLISSRPEFSNSNKGKTQYSSVRCLRDADVGGTTPSAPSTMSCDDVMECLGDTLNKLNTTIDGISRTVDFFIPVADGQPCRNAITVKDKQGNEYNTVRIGNQCWMKENLRYSGSSGLAKEVNSFGGFYSWQTVSTGNICPVGWHVPTSSEWRVLLEYVQQEDGYRCCGDTETYSNNDAYSINCVAKALSNTTGWNSNTSDGCFAGNTGEKSNATGFSAIPAGFFNPGTHTDVNDKAWFWCSDAANDTSFARAWCLTSSSSTAKLWSYDKNACMPVRCLKDN